MVVIEEALITLWANFVSYIPGILAAVIILVIGLIIGKVLGRVVKEILVRTNIDQYFSKKELISIDLSSLGSVITRWIIYLVFIQQAAIFLGVEAITTFIGSVISIIPGIIEAVIVILVGYALAIFMKESILSSKSVYADIIGKIVFFLVIYVSIALALPFVGVNPALINNLLLVFIASIGLGLAIAIGLGLKDVIAALGKDYVAKFKKKGR